MIQMDKSINQMEPKLSTLEAQGTKCKQDTYLSKYEILEDVQEVQ